MAAPTSEESVKALVETAKVVSEKYNELSEAFIRFSIAYNEISRLAKDLENPPTNLEKDNKC